jgi:hypothetical protein
LTPSFSELASEFSLRLSELASEFSPRLSELASEFSPRLSELASEFSPRLSELASEFSPRIGELRRRLGEVRRRLADLAREFLSGLCELGRIFVPQRDARRLCAAVPLFQLKQGVAENRRGAVKAPIPG